MQLPPVQVKVPAAAFHHCPCIISVQVSIVKKATSILILSWNSSDLTDSLRRSLGPSGVSGPRRSPALAFSSTGMSGFSLPDFRSSWCSCNRAGRAQPLAGSHCCVLLLSPLLLSIRSCSAIAPCLSGPCPQQPTISEWPLVVLLNYWSGLQCAPPTSTCQSLGRWLSQQAVVWWSSSGDWHKRQIQAFSWWASSLPRLGPEGQLASPGNRLGTTSCRAPELSLRPLPLALAQPLRQQWTSPPSLSLQPNSSGHLCELQSERSGLPTWVAWANWGPVGLDAWLPQGWQLGRMWEPGPERATNWDLPPLSQDWGFGVQVVPWDFVFSCQDRE